MPLFMDRHDVPGATAQDAANAHVSDLEMSHKHGVEFLSYWFDAEGGGVFCFAKAPSRQSLEAVHRESHGLVPNEIIGVEEGDVLRFLGRIHDPRDYSEVTSPIRTVLFTDLEGSTAMLDAVGEEAFLALLAEHDNIIRRALIHTRGREVKHTGDGIMAVFDGATNALRCAETIQSGFTSREATTHGPAMRVRIGLACGRPVDRNDDIYGSTVILASRICNAATGGQTLVTEPVHKLGSGDGFAFREVGRWSLKGFSEAVQVFELVSGHAAAEVASRTAPAYEPARGLRRWTARLLGRR